MKTFDDIVKAIGLDPSKTGQVVRGGAKYNIVYETVPSPPDGSDTALRIQVGHNFHGLLTAKTWDPPASGGGQGGLIVLSCARPVAKAGSYRYSVACQWSLIVQAVTSDGVDMVFGHDSDLVTTWLIKVVTVMMNDFRDYLE